MREMPGAMTPTAPEMDEMPDRDETVRLVGFARGLRELEARRRSGDAPGPDDSGPMPDVLRRGTA